jgi:chorismate mutase
MTKTKAQLEQEILDLNEERNKLCKRISELTAPQFEEHKQKAQEEKFYKDENIALENENGQLKTSMLAMGNLSNIGRTYIEELSESQMYAILTGIGAISIATFSILDEDADNDD